jgi:hypothetical protein
MIVPANMGHMAISLWKLVESSINGFRSWAVHHIRREGNIIAHNLAN